jgi:hypothetical protein
MEVAPLNKAYHKNCVYQTFGSYLSGQASHSRLFEECDDADEASSVWPIGSAISFQCRRDVLNTP